MHIERSIRLSALALLLVFPAGGAAQNRKRAPANPVNAVLLQVIRAEDERRWDDSLKRLLAHEDPKLRKRAVLAAGRIGNEAAVPVLTEMVLMDRDIEVRRMAAFALGEIESRGGAYALTQVLKKEANEDEGVRARSVEALGKIVASAIAPNLREKPDEEWLDNTRAEIVGALRFENSRRANSSRQTILLALTAVLRSRPDGVGKLLAEFLDYADARIVADALNTLARLRLKEGSDKARELLVKHNDPIVRANAARALGAAEDKPAFDALVDRALNDYDLRVRVSAIRVLALLKDARASQPLLERGEYLLKLTNVGRQFAIEPRNELLEIATVLGLLLPNSNHQTATDFLRRLREQTNAEAVEVEVAFARVAPQRYATEMDRPASKKTRSLANGVSELATIKTGNLSLDASNREAARNFIHHALNCPREKPQARRPLSRVNMGGGVVTMFCTPLETIAVSSFLRAYAAFKPDDLRETLSNSLLDEDVVVRATAADLLGEQTPSEANTRVLIDAIPRAMREADNGAALAILNALAKQKYKVANDAIKTALDSRDHLIRRRAVALLKDNGLGDFSDRIGTVQTRNTDADYRRALARIGKRPTATLVTSKGSFTIEFLPEEAPLTIDNFIQLAKRGYFNGQTVPRVVPNFVVQAGDPRGDQSGGPGYTIRCEINQAEFERAAVGMALSGKDTGGSQWFVTHSPQPHLDGGYTVFGRVVRGMEVIDRIARGDRIVRVVVNER